MYSPCDYVNRFNDNQPKPLTKVQFLSFLNGSDVKMTTAKVREHGRDAEVWKKELPAVCWQAHFDGKLRNAENAKPTGMFCLDIDYQHSQKFKEILQQCGVDAAWGWGKEHARLAAERWAQMQKCEDSDSWHGQPLNIVGIHVSPQEAGVHVIAMCQDGCKSIAENQARLARVLGTEYDAVCKDWARIYFLTPREDWTYLDMDSIFEE